MQLFRFRESETTKETFEGFYFENSNAIINTY
jgi:hypothetical protein